VPAYPGYGRPGPEPEPPEEPSGPDETDAVADREVLAGALGALPVREREVLLLFHLEDLPLAGAAAVAAAAGGLRDLGTGGAARQRPDRAVVGHRAGTPPAHPDRVRRARVDRGGLGAFGTWAVTRRAPLFARDRVVAGWLGVAAWLLFTAGALVITTLRTASSPNSSCW